MSRLLSELLAAEEPLFTKTLSQLELASGNPSADLRLSSEVSGKVFMKLKELGLDPHDTTGEELYAALLSLVRSHDAMLAKSMGVTDPEDVQAVVKNLASFARKMDVPKKVWVLKHAAAKKLLVAKPPKKIMKHLGYRSVDSMVKREKVPELFAALRFAEDGEWLNSFLQLYKKLTPADFEVRNIEIVTLDKKKWGALTDVFVHKKRHNLTHLKELGVIVILPMPMERMRGIVITVLPLLLHYYNEVRLYSSYFKLQQVRPDFGEVLVDTLIADPDKHAVMAGKYVHWRIIQRYFGKLENEDHPEIFQPHLQPEDLHWRKAEEVLYRIEPALHFWYDLDYVAVMFDGRPITFNLMDIAISYVNEIPYASRAIYHFRESLWNEIFIRYMGQKTLERQILKQLDNEMVAPELLG